MTEAEWLECKEPERMLDFLEDASHRKLRLFAVACCRRIWHLLPDERSRNAVEIAERWADKTVGAEALAAAVTAAEQAIGREPFRPLVFDASGAVTLTPEQRRTGRLKLAAKAAWYTAYYVDEAAHTAAGDAAGNAAGAALEVPAARWDDPCTEDLPQCNLLRDIFGSHFDLPPIDASWRTTNVTALAQAIYTDLAFDRLPILADALEDAGCTNQDILNHCRQPAEHVRGCWVVDLLIGKS